MENFPRHKLYKTGFSAINVEKLNKKETRKKNWNGN